MNNINETLTHPQNGSVNQFSGYGAPKMEDFAATSPSGQGVSMGTGPIMGDPEKGAITPPMINTGSGAMKFKSASSDPSGFPLPQGRTHAEFNSHNALESKPDGVVTKIETDKIIHPAKTQIY